MNRLPGLLIAGRTVVVTGGTGGIGRATALGLARLGAHVAITGRDTERAEAAAQEIRAASGGNVDVFVADLSSQTEVRQLAAKVVETYPRLDVLVNNVGGYWNTRRVTADGLEHTFALNHLAPFLLTHLLLDRLKNGGPARVVTVSSNAQAMGRIDFDDLQGERSYSGARAYNQSKLANVMFTYELARKRQGSAVTANVVHPGVVRTAFGAEDRRGIQRVLVPLARPFMKTPARGAATSIHLAAAPDLEQTTGGYFANCKPQAFLQAQLRRGRRGAAVAGQLQPGRPDYDSLSQPKRHMGGNQHAVLRTRARGSVATRGRHQIGLPAPIRVEKLLTAGFRLSRFAVRDGMVDARRIRLPWVVDAKTRVNVTLFVLTTKPPPHRG